MAVTFDFEWQYIKGPVAIPASAVDNVAGYAIGESGPFTVDTMSPIPNPGRTLTFAGHATVYTVTAATATSITVIPALTDALVDDEVITIIQEITVEDALKNRNGASGWLSSDTDTCRPFALDLVVEYTPNCANAEVETITLPDYRYESLAHDLRAATIASSGQCNATEAVSVRSAQV